MRRLILLLAVLGAGCATHSKLSLAPAPGAPDTSHVMALIGRFGGGHACPISSERVLTAAHMIDPDPGNKDFAYQFYRWSDEAGAEGYLIPQAVVVAADLAVMSAIPALEHWYARAAVAPQPGDRLWLVRYDFDSMDVAYRAEAVELRTLRVVAGNVIFRPSGTAGSSGSCVLNAAGELVGINVWGKTVGWAGGQEVGVAVGVWGKWLELEEAK